MTFKHILIVVLFIITQHFHLGKPGNIFGQQLKLTVICALQQYLVYQASFRKLLKIQGM